ncbi:MAG: hypothetical protein AB1656_20695 [Candidatus Omnitrophota bacterium]
MGLWQFLLVWAVGFALARGVRLTLPFCYRLAVAFGLGEMAITALLFLLGCFGGLRFWILVPLAATASLLFLPAILRELNEAGRRAWPFLRQSPLASVISAFLLLLYALGACTPEREVDSIWYHLAVPLHYVMNGGFIQLVPFNMPSHYPMNLHLHYAFSLLVGNEITAKVFIYCHFYPMLLLLWAAVKRYGSKSWGLFACAVYLCCLHFRLPVMANNERAVFFHVFCSVVLIWYALETRRIRIFWLSALFCGMAMGTKFNGILFGFLGNALFICLHYFLWRRKELGSGICRLSLYAAIAISLYSPWAVKSYLYTGNPLYPMMEELFSTKEEFIPAMQSNANNHGLNLLKSKSAGEFFGQVRTNAAWFLYDADLIFFLGLSALSILPLLNRKRWLHPTASAAIAYGLFPMLWGSDIARLFAVNYGVIVLSITLLASWIARHVRLGYRLGNAILVCLFVTFVQQRYMYLRSPNIQWFGGICLTEKAREEWLVKRHIFSREMFRMKRWLDVNVSPDDQLFGLDTGYLFYLRRKNIVCDAHFGKKIQPMEVWLRESPERATQQLSELGVRWLLWKEEGSSIQQLADKSLWEAFVSRYLEPAHREGPVVLYRFHESRSDR